MTNSYLFGKDSLSRIFVNEFKRLDWDISFEYPIFDRFKKYIGDENEWKLAYEDGDSLICSVDYDPDADFNGFLFAIMFDDGKYKDFNECIDDVIEQVVYCELDQIQSSDCNKVHYTVGNVFVQTEHGISKTNMWWNDTLTKFILPVKVELYDGEEFEDYEEDF